MQLCLSSFHYVLCILKTCLRRFAPSRVSRVWTTEPALLRNDTDRRVKSINYCIKQEITESKAINVPPCSINTTRKRHCVSGCVAPRVFHFDVSGKSVASLMAFPLYSRGKRTGTHQTGRLLGLSESLLSLPRRYTVGTVARSLSS